MAQSKVSLTWDAYKSNVCSGLTSLQQSEEFVDMTLAADGHFVKVHQVILALASPYIKELISSIQCSHPVIFLNKISHQTLSLILEYIYTGEVMVSLENLTDLLVAGRELHIKGLEGMKIHDGLSVKQPVEESENEMEENEVCYFEVSADQQSLDDNSMNNVILGHTINYSNTKIVEENNEEPLDEITDMQVIEHSEVMSEVSRANSEKSVNETDGKKNGDKKANIMQYTVSNQGSLQMILNRYVYYLKHTNRNNTRQWRCVDYVSHIKCPAHVITRGDMVMQRIAAHTHPFHDSKILKKVRRGSIFTAIKEAESIGSQLKIKANNPQDKVVNTIIAK